MSRFTYVDPKGYQWKPYSIEFESPEGVFGVEVWAVSFEHAELQLQALKETGKVVGVINERIER